MNQTPQDQIQALEAERDRYRALQAVVTQANQGVGLSEVLDHLYESMRPLLPCDRMGLALVDEAQTEVTAQWTRSEGTRIQIRAGYSAPLSGSSLQRILLTGRPRILNDLEVYLQEHPDSDSTRRIVAEGMRSSLTLPLTALGRHVGFVFLSSLRPGAYGQEHVGFLMELAGQLSVIVEKARSHDELERWGRVVQEFVGVAAHDLRSPLTVTKGFVDLLLQGTLGPLSARQAQVLGRVQDRCEGMLLLTEDLVDLASLGVGGVDLDLRSVDLAAVLESLAQGARVLAEAKGIQVDLDLDPELPHARADRRRLEQVVDNLVSNAIKYSPSGTVVRVHARRAKRGLMVVVEDQGPGIPEAERKLIFEPFYRGSSRPTAGESSTGLGLSIAQRLVSAMGGRLWLSSRPGQGATFSFTLPPSQ